jgi:hypothetical protein
MPTFLRSQNFADAMKTYPDTALIEIAGEASDAAAISCGDDVWSALCRALHNAASDESERRGSA